MVEAGMVAVTMYGVYYVCSGTTKRLVVGALVLMVALCVVIMGAWHGVDVSMGAAARGMQ